MYKNRFVFHLNVALNESMCTQKSFCTHQFMLHETAWFQSKALRPIFEDQSTYGSCQGYVMGPTHYFECRRQHPFSFSLFSTLTISISHFFIHLAHSESPHTTHKALFCTLQSNLEHSSGDLIKILVHILHHLKYVAILIPALWLKRQSWLIILH